MPGGKNWRDSAAYDHIEQLEPAELAWEFLRRNARYRRDYQKTPRPQRGRAADALTARWGLRFPDRAGNDRKPG